MYTYCTPTGFRFRFRVWAEVTGNRRNWLDFGTHQTKICIQRTPDEGRGEPNYEFFKFIDLNSRVTSLPQGLLLWPRTQSLHVTLCSRWNLGNGFPLTHMCAHLWGPHSCSPWGPLSTEPTLDQEGSRPSSDYFQWRQLPLQPHPSSKPSATPCSTSP